MRTKCQKLETNSYWKLSTNISSTLVTHRLFDSAQKKDCSGSQANWPRVFFSSKPYGSVKTEMFS